MTISGSPGEGKRRATGRKAGCLYVRKESVASECGVITPVVFGGGREGKGPYHGMILPETGKERQRQREPGEGKKKKRKNIKGRGVKGGGTRCVCVTGWILRRGTRRKHVLRVYSAQGIRFRCFGTPYDDGHESRRMLESVEACSSVIAPL